MISYIKLTLFYQIYSAYICFFKSLQLILDDHLILVDIGPPSICQFYPDDISLLAISSGY